MKQILMSLLSQVYGYTSVSCCRECQARDIAHCGLLEKSFTKFSFLEVYLLWTLSILLYPLSLNITTEVIQDLKKKDFSKLLPYLLQSEGSNKLHRLPIWVRSASQGINVYSSASTAWVWTVVGLACDTGLGPSLRSMWAILKKNVNGRRISSQNGWGWNGGPTPWSSRNI